MKMVYYEPVKVIINAPGLAKMIINVVVWHPGLPNSIITDWCSIFILKFRSLFCYFLGIKRKLSTTFYLQTNSQTRKQNTIIETYLQAFVNFEWDHWTGLLSIVEFAYNNAKKTNTSHESFDLNYGY